MNYKRFVINLVLILFLYPSLVIAQSQETITITGKVVESDNKQAVEYATIVLMKKNGQLITGCITDAEGQFVLESQESGFVLKVDFMGFESLEIHDYDIVKGKVDFKTLELHMNRAAVDEVTVRSEKSQIVFKTDKRVFNVGQDLVSAGGSALEVLNNVPSVDVNIEGTVSLRGNSNVQILINGKPSVITEGNSLGTITAEMIDKIEVITNPSAKYDAEGTSGILNIIMKKEEKKGMNGSVTINTGYPHNHSLGLSLNRRTEHFNMFSQFGVGYRRFKSKNESYTIDKTVDEYTRLNTDGTGEKNEQFYNVILGTDYHINKYNVLTLSGHLAYEIEDENALYEYDNLDANNNSFFKQNRTDLTEATNPKMEYQLNYDKSFKRHKEQKLTISASGSYFGKDKISEFENTTLSGTDEQTKQKADTKFSNQSYDFSADYVHPFSKRSKLEAGAKYLAEVLTNDYVYSNWENEAWINDANYTNTFDYSQNVAAVYSSFDYEMKKLGVKAGLRLEHTEVNTNLHQGNQKNNQSYTDLFPSFHTNYKFSDRFSLQVGYSRRISRPDLWDVNPFFRFRDTYNLRTGNPDLLPEYSHAFELTSVKMWKAGSVSASLFHRRTNNVMSDVVKIVDDVTITTQDNIGNNYSTGIEINSKTELFKWMSLLTDLSYRYYQREGQYEATDFDFTSSTYSARLTSKYKLPAQFDLELRGRYHSEYKDVQTVYKAMTTMDLGLRKKMFKGKAVVHLTISDLFNSRKRTQVSDQANFYRFSEYSRDGRRIIIGFSYGFGKGEAMEYSGRKMF